MLSIFYHFSVLLHGLVLEDHSEVHYTPYLSVLAKGLRIITDNMAKPSLSSLALSPALYMVEYNSPRSITSLSDLVAHSIFYQQ